MRRDPFRLTLALVLLSAAPVLALDPQRAASQYVIAKRSAAGLPGVGIHSIVQTTDRYLWLATMVGLIRFDGDGFTVFNGANTPDFGDGGVSRLALGADGSLFVGTTAGIVLRYRDGTFARIERRTGTAFVSSLLAARDGSLWIGLPGHDTLRWREGVADSFPELHGVQAPLALAEDKSGAVWIPTQARGLVRYVAGRFEHYAATRDTVQALCPDRAGALWIGTPHGLLRQRGKKLDRYTTRDGLSSDNVSALLEDKDGNLWIGTSGGGLSRLSAGGWSRLTTAEGLSDDDVRSLFEDHEGNLWVGTAEGLDCISDGRFITYGRFELGEPAVSAVAASHGPAVWLGMASGHVIRLGERGPERFVLPGGMGRERVLALHEMRDGSLWIAEDNARVFRLKDGVVTEHTPVGIAEVMKVRAISEDEQGPLFMVSLVGPARIEGRRLVPIAPRPPPRFLRYTHAAYRHGEALWICDLFGLVRVANGVWKSFTRSDGLPANRVRSASLEPDGALWLATAGGLGYLKGDRIRTLSVREGLPENYLRLVLDDQLGHLWIASMGRIFRLEKREIFEVFAGKAKGVQPLLFDTSDGLRTTEALLSNGPGFRGADGRLWFATARGASVIDPRRLSTDDPAPPVRIEYLSVDGRASQPAQAGPAAVPAEYPPGRGEVAVEYSALAFRAPGRVRFRRRLEGFDADWVAVGTSRRAYYSNLPPGRYRFSVAGANRDGVWNGAVVSVAFTLQRPFYQTLPFLFACGGATFGLGFVAHRVRVKQVSVRMAAVIRERTRLARELHDTLAQGLAGAKLHIDTALSALADKPDLARRSMQCARSITTSSLAEVRRSIWVLRTQAATGEEGLAASLVESLAQLAGDHEVLPMVQVRGRLRTLPVDTERSLLRIAHEAVTNALRHSAAKSIAVELDFDDNGLDLRVRDDGRGFCPERFLNGHRGEHFGLLGIRERVQALGGTFTVRSRPGEGTEVACRLPYESAGPAQPPAHAEESL